jgi:hypothetical protein
VPHRSEKRGAELHPQFDSTTVAAKCRDYYPDRIEQDVRPTVGEDDGKAHAEAHRLFGCSQLLLCSPATVFLTKRYVIDIVLEKFEKELGVKGQTAGNHTVSCL